MDKIKLAQRTIALLSSMIESGECHTARTKEMKTNALNGLDEVNNLLISGVSNWVAILSTEQPEIMTDVMVKYKDGRKEVAFFDGDKRFYIEKDDRDITETIVEWHKLP